MQKPRTSAASNAERWGVCRVNLKIGLLQYLFFFFQAEDGIRDLTVTGVQTCALSNFISRPPQSSARSAARIADSSSTNAVSFSSARATKRFPSPRCASGIQMNKKIGVSQQILTDWQTQDTPRTWLPLSVSVCGIGEPADSCSQRCASPVCRQSSSALATVRSKSKFAKATFHTSEPQHCHP